MTKYASEEEQNSLDEISPLETDIVSLTPDATTPEKQSWLSGGRGIAIGIIIGIAITFVGTRFLASESSETPVAEPVAEDMNTASRSVTAAIVEPESVESTLEATGTVAAFELVPVKAQQSGYQIEAVLVKEGDFVEKGQLLARLDNSILRGQYEQSRASVAQAEARLAELRAGSRVEEIASAQARLEQAEARLNEAKASIPRRIEQAQAQVASAQARLDLAENRYENYQGLLENGAISRDRFNEVLSEYRSAQASLAEAEQRLQEARNTNDPGIAQLEASVRENQAQLRQLRAGVRQETITQAEAQLAEAQARLQTITAQLDNTRITAPVSGTILERNARVGDIPSGASEPLFTIIQDGRLELLLKVPETQLSAIETGQSVLITSNANPDLELTGRVREIDPLVSENSRQATIKVSLPASEDLQPGMFLRGAIVTESDTGLTIPAKAVLPQANGNTIVYVIQPDNTVEAKPVEVGELLSGEKIEIASGLVAGDRVVVKGAAYLKEGDTVSVNSQQ